MNKTNRQVLSSLSSEQLAIVLVSDEWMEFIRDLPMFLEVWLDSPYYENGWLRRVLESHEINVNSLHDC